MTIKDINKREDLTLVTDTQDVKALKEYFGNNPDLDEIDGFFVKVEDGEYTEIYGFSGIIPYLNKTLTVIKGG